MQAPLPIIKIYFRIHGSNDYNAATTPSIPTIPPIAAINAGAPALLVLVLGEIPVNVPVPKTAKLVVGTGVVAFGVVDVVFTTLDVVEFLSLEVVLTSVVLRTMGSPVSDEEGNAAPVSVEEGSPVSVTVSAVSVEEGSAATVAVVGFGLSVRVAAEAKLSTAAIARTENFILQCFCMNDCGEPDRFRESIEVVATVDA